MERTLVLIKPDAFEHECATEILKRFLDAGLGLIAAKKTYVDAELVARHYKDRFAQSPEFKDSVTEYLMSGPVLALVLERKNAVELARIIIGPLGGGKKSTIRGDFPSGWLHSLVHGSDSTEAAEYEIRVWFPELGVEEKQQTEGGRMTSFDDLKPAERHFVEAVASTEWTQFTRASSRPEVLKRSSWARKRGRYCLRSCGGARKAEDMFTGFPACRYGPETFSRNQD